MKFMLMISDTCVHFVHSSTLASLADQGGQVVEFHVAPEVNPADGLPYHEWFVEFAEVPSNPEAFGQALDAELQGRNPYCRDLITGSVLRTAVLNPLPPGAFHDAMARRGKLGGQNKVPQKYIFSNYDTFICVSI